jgi:hypothetical protein
LPIVERNYTFFNDDPMDPSYVFSILAAPGLVGNDFVGRWCFPYTVYTFGVVKENILRWRIIGFVKYDRKTQEPRVGAKWL